MEVTVRLGAMKDGRIRAIDLYTLSNGGAYGEHSTTTVGLSGHKSLPALYGADVKRQNFHVMLSTRMFRQQEHIEDMVQRRGFLHSNLP